MKRLSVVIFLLMTFASSAHSESPQKLGIGLVLGAPTGFSLRYWESSRIAYQGSIGAMFSRGLFLGDPGFAGPSYSRRSLALGVRAAFGVDYFVRDYPFDIAVELGPALLLTPVTGMGFQLSVAFRFYP
jgi:hypothetical protein